MRRAILVPLVAALCFGVGACGSGGGAGSTSTSPSPPLSAKAYTAFLSRLSKLETQIQAAAQKELGSKSLSDISAALSKYADEQQGVGERVSNVAPPANAKAANAALAKGFTDSAAAIHALVPQISSAGSVDAAQKLLTTDKDALQAGSELDTALMQLKKLGYLKGS